MIAYILRNARMPNVFWQKLIRGQVFATEARGFCALRQRDDVQTVDGSRLGMKSREHVQPHLNLKLMTSLMTIIICTLSKITPPSPPLLQKMQPSTSFMIIDLLTEGIGSGQRAVKTGYGMNWWDDYTESEHPITLREI